MSNENIKNFVNSLEKGDNIKAADDFKSSLADKVSSALDDRKTEVARSMFTSAVGVKAPEADVFSGNNIENTATETDTPTPEVASDEVAQ